MYLIVPLMWRTIGARVIGIGILLFVFDPFFVCIGLLTCTFSSKCLQEFEVDEGLIVFGHLSASATIQGCKRNAKR
jgi:hypothetical protein